jgi:hypothetical protein
MAEIDSLFQTALDLAEPWPVVPPSSIYVWRMGKRYTTQLTAGFLPAVGLTNAKVWL